MSSSSGMAAPGTAGAGADRAALVRSPARRGLPMEEFTGLVLPVVMPLVRRLPAVILVLTALCTTVALLVLVGAARDDAAIGANSAVATAEVLPGSDFGRTLVRFTTADGKSVLPERGVFYPRGLRPGQIVRVEYDRAQPELVRVLDRDASIGYWPIGLLVLVLWVTLLPLAFWLRGRQLLRLEAAAEAALAAPPAVEDPAVPAADPAEEQPSVTRRDG